MRIKIGNDQYYDCLNIDDFYNIMQLKISWEFMHEFKSIQEKEIEDIKEDWFSTGYYHCYQDGNCHILEMIDETLDDLKTFLDPIKKGKRLNRENTIKFLEDLVFRLGQVSG